MILYSSNSKDWQLKNLSNSFQVNFNNIAYGNSQYFVGTDGDYSGPKSQD